MRDHAAVEFIAVEIGERGANHVDVELGADGQSCLSNRLVQDTHTTTPARLTVADGLQLGLRHEAGALQASQCK